MDSPIGRELIIKLQSGSLEALGLLYDRYNRMVYRTALAITGDDDAAADLLQDVFLRLYRFANRIDPNRPLEPWLYRVTANLACTWVKRRRWLHSIEDLAEWFVRETRPSPPQRAEGRDEWRALEKAMASLPLAQRTVIVLYYISELSVQEIAEILEIPDGTVKSRLHYGRKALRDHMTLIDGSVSEVRYEFT